MHTMTETIIWNGESFECIAIRLRVCGELCVYFSIPKPLEEHGNEYYNI